MIVPDFFNLSKEVVSKATTESSITEAQFISVYPGVTEIPQKLGLNHHNYLVTLQMGKTI